MTVTIASLKERDFFAWYALYTEYAASEGVQLADEQVMRVWTTLQSSEAHGVVASDTAGGVVGLAHFTVFERLLRGDTGYAVEDLFVSEGSRRQGVATALVEHIRTRAESERRPLLRWSTTNDDAAARALKDKFADPTGSWVLQTLPVA